MASNYHLGYKTNVVRTVSGIIIRLVIKIKKRQW